MITKLNPSKIAQLLNQSTRQLDESTLTALTQARHNALRKQASRRAPVFEFAPASARNNHAASWIHGLIPHTAKQWLYTGLIAAALVIGTSYWQQVQEQQNDDLDVAILTDDLPIEAFVE